MPSQLPPINQEKYHHVFTKISNQKKLRILFINDLGFQYGAGMAFLRQIQSFLLLGHEVSGICYLQGYEESRIPFIPNQATGKWLGMTQFPHLHPEKGANQSVITDTLVSEAKNQQPDVVIVGNIHSAGWSVELFLGLQSLGCPVIAYMHDCYFATGRCAYPGECTKYQTGCDQTCPTWEQYPVLKPEKIKDQWRLRQKIFNIPQGIPLVTNSLWTLQFAKQAFGKIDFAECVYYGLDSQLFQEIDKTLARKLLGIPQNKFVILGGAVNTNDYRKGGHIFKEIVAQFQDSAVHFLTFGVESPQLQGIQTTGFLRDYRKMPIIYSAADLFVGTSLEEAFGQTFCEAAACARPSVAFALGGIPEVAQHNCNARLAKEVSAGALLQEIKFFQENPQKCQEFGQAGRKMVEEQFTLQSQGKRWMNYLQRLVKHKLNA